MIVLINILLLLIPILLHKTYCIDEKTHFFSPYIYPNLKFTISYYIPSSAIFVTGIEKKVLFHHTLFWCLIISFFLGTILSKKCHNPISFQTIKKLKDHELTIIFCLSIGIVILTCYGVWTKIPFKILTGENIEGLRRTAEVGKGFVKTTGYFIIIFSTLILLETKRLKNNKAKKKLIVLFISCYIFMMIGHKTQSLLLIVLHYCLSMRNKEFHYRKAFILGISIVLLIGLMNSIRSTGSYKSLMSRTGTYLKIYNYNYVPIVKEVEAGRLVIKAGSEYLQGIYTLIPRTLYPNKPLSFDYFLKQYFNRDFEGGGLPPTIVGSLYLNLGFKGSLIAMFIIGFMYKKIYDLFFEVDPITAIPISLILFFLLEPSQFVPKIQYIIIFFSIVSIMIHILNGAIIKSR